MKKIMGENDLYQILRSFFVQEFLRERIKV